MTPNQYNDHVIMNFIKYVPVLSLVSVSLLSLPGISKSCLAEKTCRC